MNANAISPSILPVTVPVATEVLEYLNQATMKTNERRQLHLALFGLGQLGCQHEGALVNGALGFDPPIKYVRGRKVRRRA